MNTEILELVEQLYGLDADEEEQIYFEAKKRYEVGVSPPKLRR